MLMKALSKLRLHNQWAVVLLSLVAFLAVAAAFELLPIDGILAQVRQIIDASGKLGPLIFVLIVILAVVIPPIPQRPFVLSAGLFFGPLLGVILIVVGATIGAIINFTLARVVSGKWTPDLRDTLHRSEQVGVLGNWLTIVLVRSFAGFAFDWYSYLLGVLRISWLSFISATVVGILPGTILEVYAGSMLDSHPWVTFAIGSIIVLIVAIGMRTIGPLKEASRILQPSSSSAMDPADRVIAHESISHIPGEDDGIETNR